MFQPQVLEEIKPMREIIYAQLRDAITSGTIKNGERLIELELAAQLRVSRTPVREAIRMLESDGLVESVPRRGVFVKGIDIDDVVEIYIIRQALEVVAFQAAAQKITDPELTEARKSLDDARAHLEAKDYEAYRLDQEEFTRVMVEASRMPRVIQLIASYRDQLKGYRKLTLSNPGRQQEAIRQHAEILEAVAAHDTEQVGRLVFAHLEGALKILSHSRTK